MTTAKDVIQMIKDKDVQYVDLRFTDPRGKWQHLTQHPRTMDEAAFSDGGNLAGKTGGLVVTGRSQLPVSRG